MIALNAQIWMLGWGGNLNFTYVYVFEIIYFKYKWKF